MPHRTFDIQPQIQQLRSDHTKYSNDIAEAFSRIQLALEFEDPIIFPDIEIPKEIRLLDTRATIAVGTDLAGHHYTVRVDSVRQIQLLDASIQVKTAPVGSSLIIDWLQSSDNGVTWTSIFPTGNANKLVLPAGDKRVTVNIFRLTPLLLSRNDLLRYDVIQVGSSTPGGKLESVLAGFII